MKRLILFDTETLEQIPVLDKVKKYTLVDAKYGRLAISILSILVFATLLAGATALFTQNKIHTKELAAMQYVRDSIETKEELDELHFAIGYLYLQTEHCKPNEDTVYNFITGCNPWYPEYIMAQAVIESGLGTSDVGKNANNMFGMKYIDQSKPHRPTTQIPGVDYKGYGMYASWELSVVDRILWELSRYKHVKPSLMKYQNGFANYAETETYTNTVISVANQYKNKK